MDEKPNMQIVPFKEVNGFDLAFSNASQFQNHDWNNASHCILQREQQQILQITAHFFYSLSFVPTILIAVLKASYFFNLFFFSPFSPSMIYEGNIKAVPKHTTLRTAVTFSS